MNVGERLKKLREVNNMTRKEAADKLRELGIDISDKTLYGYESGRNSANADMFFGSLPNLQMQKYNGNIF